MSDLYVFDGDLAMFLGDFKIDKTLSTALILSLFTDERADGQRGWWGGKMGSKLWTLQREKQTKEVLIKAEEYAREALLWVENEGFGIIRNITPYYSDKKTLIINVAIEREGQLFKWDLSDLYSRS